MTFRTAAVTVAALCLGLATAVQAQVVGIVTTPAGSPTNSIGSAIAKVAVEKAGLRVTVQPQQSPGLEPVNAGTVELSLTNAVDLAFFVAGTEFYEGKGKKENIRLVARVLPLLVGVWVRTDSGIKTLKDLKGKRIGAEFGAQRVIHRLFEAHLANVGLTYNDVQKALARNVTNGADDFAAGKTDAFVFALGAAKVKEVNSSVGAIMPLSLDTSAEAIARVQALLPGSYPYLVRPTPRMPEITQPANVIAYDLLLFSNAQTPEATIYKIVKAMHGNKQALVATFGGLNDFDPNAMAIGYDRMSYHPGAEKFYREAGQWPPKKPGA